MQVELLLTNYIQVFHLFEGVILKQERCLWECSAQLDKLIFFKGVKHYTIRVVSFCIGLLLLVLFKNLMIFKAHDLILVEVYAFVVSIEVRQMRICAISNRDKVEF